MTVTLRSLPLFQIIFLLLTTIFCFTAMADIVELTDFYKETNAKTRAPESLKHGCEFKVKEFYRVRSKFGDKDGVKPIRQSQLSNSGS